jgi:hypothetical protein
MVSSAEAFDRFRIWKNHKTLLKLTVMENEELPEKFLGSVTLVENESLVSFMDHDRRLPRLVDFSSCAFELGASSLLAIRGDGELFSCEDTGKSWVRTKFT